MGESRDSHLKGNAGDAAKCFVHVQYFLRDSLGIADQQRTRGSAHGVELRPGSRRPAALFADLGECVRIPRIKVIRCLLSRVSQKTDGVKTHDEFLGGVTSASTCVAIESDKRAEALGFAAYNSHH